MFENDGSGDVAPEEVTEPTIEQSVTDQDNAGGDQSTEAVEKLSEFAVGNQDFKNLDGLKKALQEAQKGFTKATQERSKLEKTYKSITDWLLKMRQDKAKFERFAKFAEAGEIPEAYLKEYLAKQQNPQPQAPKVDPMVAEMEDRLSRTEAELEYSRFRSQHPDVDDALAERIVEQVVQWNEQGKDRSLEEAHRWIMADEYKKESVAAKEAAEKAAKTKGANATSLGSTPATAQGKGGPKAKVPNLENDAELKKFIENQLDEVGFKPE